jgi:hypothetical protein
VHASDLADVLEEDSGDAQRQDDHLRTGGSDGVSIGPRRKWWRGRRARVWEKGATRVVKRRVGEKEAGRKPATAERGQAAAAISPAGVEPTHCSGGRSPAFLGWDWARSVRLQDLVDEAFNPSLRFIRCCKLLVVLSSQILRFNPKLTFNYLKHLFYYFIPVCQNLETLHTDSTLNCFRFLPFMISVDLTHNQKRFIHPSGA